MNYSNCPKFQIDNPIWKWQEGTYVIDGIQQYFNEYMWLPQKMSFFIQLTKNQEVKYIYEGEILRIDQVLDKEIKPEIMKNLVQIKHLRWEGQYGKNKEKIGKWIAYWKNQDLNIGGYYENGLKTGIWIDIEEDFWNDLQFLYTGEYKNGRRKGKWETMYREYEENEFFKIGGGFYNEDGKKDGIWIDLHENFQIWCYVIYIGEYHNDNRKGKWEIRYKSYQDQEFRIIGGGNYNEQGRKDGNWIDIIDAFDKQNSYIKKGHYQNGKPIGNFQEEKLN
ncbi:unnamed protein product [Paramecium sonneborni]|uniref:MORN repeat protein n=1 Tax=Paramecium sonneborni TaxID=65129 RepID=A0A8S1RLQ5_9CILI|nr:unnamed protein product [Paramecium sonneborni]